MLCFVQEISFFCFLACLAVKTGDCGVVCACVGQANSLLTFCSFFYTHEWQEGESTYASLSTKMSCLMLYDARVRLTLFRPILHSKIDRVVP